MRCPFCSSTAPEGSRYCPSCAAPLGDLSESPTLLPPGAGAQGSTQAPGLASSDSLADGRFVPGTILGGRYRIIGLLGTGGMGEVYRATDLKLAHPVALKFLPEALAQDPGRVARFFNEVKIARQISHPNVCRVYDLGESGGLHFLSMEYVDGEDLASLLRRIGRMPHDRAVQIARQLCAGLAAAHQQGILHRDLKPANVMIDGRGQAKITDFGLAAAGHEIAPHEVRVGTPAYMAPEQLAGQQVSTRSDLYALGLVLYELFTGKPPFKADTPAELMKTQSEMPPPSPSSVVDGIDPSVERAILRCLEHDPRQRPATALAVAAALPGGDPLAAALAAGEIPSPEMVADAGEVGGLRSMVGAACLAVVLLGLVGLAWLSGRTQMVARVDLPRPPEALAVEARELIASSGYTAAPADSAYAFGLDDDYLAWVQKHDTSPHRWAKLGVVRPSPLRFWYRQSPRPLVPVSQSGFVFYGNPPALISGMASLELDPQGRLLSLLAVPPEHDEAVAAAAPVPIDWSPLFKAAGLDPDRFSRSSPSWNPAISCGERFAWTGEYPDQPGVPIQVEACSYGGRPAFFTILAPWSRPGRMEAAPVAEGLKVAAGIGVVVVAGLVLAGALIARRNLRLGRSDRRGAIRVAAFVFAAQMIFGLLRINHVAGYAELGLIVDVLKNALLLACFVWLIYVALEPAVRRLWPDVLISWSRLLAGRFRDPLVGHDILVGGVAGVIVCTGLLSISLAATGAGLPESQPLLSSLDPLIGLREAVGIWIGSQVSTLGQPIGVLFLVLLLRVLLRRQWLAVGLTAMLFSSVAVLVRIEPTPVPAAARAAGLAVIFLIALAVWTVILSVMIRSGLLASVVLFLVANAVLLFPPTLDLSAWYASRSWIGAAGVVAVCLYAFLISRTSRGPAWDELLAT